jgi:hypothetical protein
MPLRDARAAQAGLRPGGRAPALDRDAEQGVEAEHGLRADGDPELERDPEREEIGHGIPRVAAGVRRAQG